MTAEKSSSVWGSDGCPDCSAPTEATGPNGYWRLCPSCGWDGSPAPDSELVCVGCGSDDIQMMMWVHANTNEVMEPCHSWNWPEAQYCHECGHQEFVSKHNFRPMEE